MVNETGFQHRRQLLSILRNSTRPRSGEQLGQELGVSRVAIHKHISSLQEYGYPVQSNRNGYQLAPGGDREILSPWDFEENENVLVYPETGSTMDLARDAAGKNPGGDLTVVAEKQSRGRRRDGGTWVSSPGGIWATRVIHARGGAHRITRFTLAASAALASELRNRFNLNARLRWPGDVFVNGLKIAGTMSEAHVVGERFNWIALGVGINANNNVYPADAVSLKALTGKTTDRRRLLRGWMAALDSLHSSGAIESDDIPFWWNNLMDGIGQKVVFFVSASGKPGVADTGEYDAATNAEKITRIEGRIVDVDGLGRLRLETSSNRTIALAAGDILKSTHVGETKNER